VDQILSVNIYTFYLEDNSFFGKIPLIINGNW